MTDSNVTENAHVTIWERLGDPELGILRQEVENAGLVRFARSDEALIELVRHGDKLYERGDPDLVAAFITTVKKLALDQFSDDGSRGEESDENVMNVDVPDENHDNAITADAVCFLKGPVLERPVRLIGVLDDGAVYLAQVRRDFGIPEPKSYFYRANELGKVQIPVTMTPRARKIISEDFLAGKKILIETDYDSHHRFLTNASRLYMIRTSALLSVKSAGRKLIDLRDKFGVLEFKPLTSIEELCNLKFYRYVTADDNEGNGNDDDGDVEMKDAKKEIDLDVRLATELRRCFDDRESVAQNNLKQCFERDNLYVRKRLRHVPEISIDASTQTPDRLDPCQWWRVPLDVKTAGASTDNDDEKHSKRTYDYGQGEWKVNDTSTIPNEFGSKYDLTGKIWNGLRTKTSTCDWTTAVACEYMSRGSSLAVHQCQAIRFALEMISKPARPIGISFLIEGTKRYQIIVAYRRMGIDVVRLSPFIDVRSKTLPAESALLSLLDARPQSLGVYDSFPTIGNETFNITDSYSVSSQSVVFVADSLRGTKIIQYLRDYKHVAEMCGLIYEKIPPLKRKHLMLPQLRCPIEEAMVFDPKENIVDDAPKEQWIRLIDALKVLHEARIVHLDITPNNILSGPDDLVFIDWGSAVYFPDDEDTAAFPLLTTLPFFPAECVGSLTAVDDDGDYDLVPGIRITFDEARTVDQVMLLRTIQYFTHVPQDRAAMLRPPVNWNFDSSERTREQMIEVIDGLFATFQTAFQENLDEWRKNLCQSSECIVVTEDKKTFMEHVALVEEKVDDKHVRVRWVGFDESKWPAETVRLRRCFPPRYDTSLMKRRSRFEDSDDESDNADGAEGSVADDLL